MKAINGINAFRDWTEKLDLNQGLTKLGTTQYQNPITKAFRPILMEANLEWCGDTSVPEEITCFRKIGDVEFKVVGKILHATKNGHNVTAKYEVDFK